MALIEVNFISECLIRTVTCHPGKIISTWAARRTENGSVNLSAKKIIFCGIRAILSFTKKIPAA